ncbi:MAG: hypothetical protein ACI4JN_00275, partial [Ruminococcus sp.]
MNKKLKKTTAFILSLTMLAGSQMGIVTSVPSFINATITASAATSHLNGKTMFDLSKSSGGVQYNLLSVAGSSPITYNDDSGNQGNRNYKMSYVCTKGQTYYIETTNFSSTTSGVVKTLVNTSGSLGYSYYSDRSSYLGETSVITNNMAVKNYVGKGSYTALVFTAPSTGTYYFQSYDNFMYDASGSESTNTFDTYGYLFSSTNTASAEAFEVKPAEVVTSTYTDPDTNVIYDVNSIKKNGFNYSGIYQLYLPSSIETIEAYAFSSGSAVYIPTANDGGFTADDLIAKGAGMAVTYTPVKDADENITGVTIDRIAVKDGLTNITIPSSVNLDGTVYTVAGIESGALTGISKNTQINIPATVQTIGANAFTKAEGADAVITALLPAENNLNVANDAQTLINAGADVSRIYTLNSGKISYDAVAYNEDSFIDPDGELTSVQYFLSNYKFADKTVVDTTFGTDEVSYNLAWLPAESEIQQVVRAKYNHTHNYVNNYEGDTYTGKTCTICELSFDANGTVIEETNLYPENERSADPYLNPETGYYEITNANELYWFAMQVNRGSSSINGMLMNDIDMSVLTLDDGETWTPIGKDTQHPYKGSFNGNNHIISNLSIDSTRNYIGLFGCINNGSVSNLGIENSEIKGYDFVGAFVGQVQNNSKIENVYASNTSVTALRNNANVGGIAGYLADAVIRYAYFADYETSCDITNAYQSTVEDSYYLVADDAEIDSSAAGEAKTAAQFESGEVAFLLQDGMTNNTFEQSVGTDELPVFNNGDDTMLWVYDYDSYSTCYVSEDENAKTVKYTNTPGAFLRYDYSVTNAAYDLTDGTPNIFKCDGKHEYDENGFCCNADEDGSPVCGVYEEPAYNSETDHFEVSNIGQLYWCANFVNGETVKDLNGNGVIDSSHSASGMVVDIVSDLDMTGYTWTPIDNFYGTLNGNGHTITGMDIVTDYQYAGMFGNGFYGTVYNLALDDVTVTSTYSGKEKVYLGAVAGYNNNNGYISDCYVTDVTFNAGSANSTVYAGGIAGYNNENINNSYTAGVTKKANIDYCGGIVGYNRSASWAPKNCYYLDQEDTFNVTDIPGVTAKTALQFASGEVAWLLDGSDNSNDYWHQTIGTDALPNFTSKDTVYGGYKHGETNAAKREYSNEDVLHFNVDSTADPHDSYHGNEIISMGDIDGHVHSCEVCGVDVVVEHDFDWNTVGKYHIGFCPDCLFTTEHLADVNDEYLITSQKHYTWNGCDEPHCDYYDTSFIWAYHTFSNAKYYDADSHLATCDVCETALKKP